MDMLSIKEVAHALRVDEMTIRRMLGRGELPYYRVGGGTIRISRADLAEYLRRGRRP